MKRDGGMVIFKSTPQWYGLEESGRKPNTLRWLDYDEYEELKSNHPTRIRIIATHSPKSFSRAVTWWGLLDICLGKCLVMFCW